MEPHLSFGVSLAIAIESHSVTCYLTQVNTPRLNPSQTGRYSIGTGRAWPPNGFCCVMASKKSNSWA